MNKSFHLNITFFFEHRYVCVWVCVCVCSLICNIIYTTTTFIFCMKYSKKVSDTWSKKNG